MAKTVKKTAPKKEAVKQEIYTNEKGDIRVKMEIDGVMVDREV